MTELEDYVVKNTYQPTEGEKKAISELKKKGLVPDDWNSSKKGSSVKCIDRVKKILIFMQK